jgi:hypothetical protein
MSGLWREFCHRVEARGLRLASLPESWVRSAFPLAFRLKCPTCAGYGHTGYDRRGRPIPCPECKGTGKAPSTPKAA